jgi:hypothetical protein
MGKREVAATLLVLGLALWFPLTRGLILYVLPFGSGFDDLIFVIALGVGITLLALGKANDVTGYLRSRWVFVVVLVSILAVSAIILSMLV